MFSTPMRRITAVWLVLVAATLLSWESANAGRAYRLAATAVLVIAFIKVRFVGLEFMELRNAPLPLRAIFEIWVALACLALLTLYWLSPAA
jgi:hypothetical protein